MYRVLVALLLAAFAIVPAGCQNKSKSGGTAASQTAGRKTMTREEFEKAVKGKTTAEVIALLGNPDQRVPAGNNEEFTYAAITKEPGASKPDLAAKVFFEKGRQVRVEFK